MIEDFLFQCRVEDKLSEHTVNAYRYDLDFFKKFIGKQDMISCLTQETLKSFLSYMLIEKKLSAATIKRRLSCLKRLCAYGENHLNLLNPFKIWSPAMKRPKKLPRALNKEDMMKLVTRDAAISSKNEEMIFYILLLSATGLRISELCGIKLGDIADDGRSVLINGKGSRERVVYIGNDALREKLCKTRRENLAAYGPEHFLMLNNRGKRLQPQSFRRRLHKFVLKQGISQKITPHMFRHSAATWLIESGTNLRFVQRLLGHASISTTEIYTHVSDEALMEALSKADPLGSIISKRNF